MTSPSLLVFSDLDGTLLDHSDYSFAAAQPAMSRLAELGIPIILNSSKTRPEMEALQAQMGLHAPFIVENGAAAVIPADTLGNAQEDVVNFAAPRSEVIAVLQRLRAEGATFEGFADMTAERVAEVTGLPLEGAARAQQRIATEPLLWQGDDAGLAQLQAGLEVAGMQLIQGGRFFHAMGQYDKADAMVYLTQRYQQRGQGPVRSIALGDSPNDARMLAAADFGVIIKGVNSNQLTMTGANILRSTGEGPIGWNECIQSLLDQLVPNVRS